MPPSGGSKTGDSFVVHDLLKMTREWPPPLSDAHPHGPIPVGRLGRVLDRLLDAYARAEAGTPADRAVREVFRSAPDLGSSERTAVRDRLFGLFRMRRRIDDVLERAATAERRNLSTIDVPMRQRMQVLAYLALTGTPASEIARLDPRAAKRIPRLFERITNGRVPAKKHAPLEALAIEVGLPTWMVRRLVESLSQTRAEPILRSLQGRAPISLRVRKGIDREEIRTRLATERNVAVELTPWSPYGLLLERAVDLTGFAPLEAGHIELQDEGSQLIALACGVQPGHIVLDACAGAGGKTLALAAELGIQGNLTAMDPEARKLRELVRRAERDPTMAPIRVQTRSLETLPDDFRGAFDVVLVDVPCSGTGTLRRAPDLAWRLRESDVGRHATDQLRLLTTASTTVAPQGRLIYATCSVFEEENEAVSRAFLESEPRFHPHALVHSWGRALSSQFGATYEARIGPGPTRKGPDGFYVAQFQRI